MGRKRIQGQANKKFNTELDFVKHTLLLNSPVYIFSIDPIMQDITDKINQSYIQYMHKIANAKSIDQATAHFIDAQNANFKKLPIDSIISINKKNGTPMFYTRKSFIEFIKPDSFQKLNLETASKLKQSILKQISKRKKIDNLFFNGQTIDDNFNYHDYTPFFLTEKATPPNELLTLYPNWYESDEIENFKTEVIKFCNKFGFRTFKFSEHTPIIDAFKQVKFLDECFSELAHDCGVKYAAIGLNYFCNLNINCKETLSGQFDSSFDTLTISRASIEFSSKNFIKSTVLHESIHAHDYYCHSIRRYSRSHSSFDFLSSQKSFSAYHANLTRVEKPLIGAYIINDIIRTTLTDDYPGIVKSRIDSIPKMFDTLFEFLFSLNGSIEPIPTFNTLSEEQKSLVLSEVFISRVCDFVLPYRNIEDNEAFNDDTSEEQSIYFDDLKISFPKIPEKLKKILEINTNKNAQLANVRKYNFIEKNLYNFEVLTRFDNEKSNQLYTSLIEMLKKIFAFEGNFGGTALSFAKKADKIMYSKNLENYNDLKKHKHEQFEGIAPLLDFEFRNNKNLEVDTFRMYYHQDPSELLARYFETNIYFWESQKYNFQRTTPTYAWKKCPEFSHFKDEFFVAMFGFDALAPENQPNHPIYSQAIKEDPVKLETSVTKFSEKVTKLRVSLENKEKKDISILYTVFKTIKNIKSSSRASISNFSYKNVEDILLLTHNEKVMMQHIKNKPNGLYR